MSHLKGECDMIHQNQLRDVILQNHMTTLNEDQDKEKEELSEKQSDERTDLQEEQLAKSEDERDELRKDADDAHDEKVVAEKEATAKENEALEADEKAESLN
jgi:hypothetical protein